MTVNPEVARRFRNSKIARILTFKLSIFRQLGQTSLSRVYSVIDKNGIDLVLDVGANVGQFAIDLRNAGYKGEIISFEPAASPFQELVRRSQKDKMWNVFNYALGDCMGVGNLHIASNGGLSSSVLKPKLHSLFFPKIVFDHTEKIQIRTLSHFIKDYQLMERKILLKIDTQGYESLIIQGAIDIFDAVIATYLELSLVELYGGEDSALAILNTLSNLGHEISDIQRGVESRDGKLLQIDVLTLKSLKYYSA